MVISHENGCEYCMAAHSTLADIMSGVAPEVTDAIRNGTPISDLKLAALAEFTSVMFQTRGLPTEESVQAFLKAGFIERHILEVVLALAVKTLSNYSNHLFHTPLDEKFAARAWAQS